MTKVQVITGLIVLAGGLNFSPPTSAMIVENAGGGWWCEPSTSSWDGEGWTVVGGDCYYDGGGGGGGYYNPEPTEPYYGGGGGGGGGGANPSFPDLAISPKLECVLKNYLHPDSKLSSGQTLKSVDAWAFKLDGSYGYKIQSSSTPPSASYKSVGGISGYGRAYGRLYKAAFQSRTLNVTGERYNSANSFNGDVSSFESSVYVAGHEAAHLAVPNATEAVADWYGVYALKAYKADNGSKCPN